MANELVAQWTLGDLVSEAAVGYNPWARAVPVDDDIGVRLFKVTDTQRAVGGYIAKCLIPGSLTMGTGLTFGFAITVPKVPDYSDDPGKVVRLGVTVKRIISGESFDMDTGAGTEQTVDVTLQSTAGLTTIATLAIAAANLDSAVVGNRIAVRVRRVGTATQDTCRGSVVLSALDVVNT